MNLVFGLILYRIRRGVLIALTVVAAALLCWVGYRAGNLPGGWSTKNFWDGGARVAFSFPAGLLIYRLGWRLRTRLGFFALSLLLILALISPYAKGGWIREVIVIVVVFPLIIALGAGASITPRVESLCRFSGDMSYPLYMTHYGVMWIWGDYAAKHHLVSSSRLWTLISLGICITVAFAWIVLRIYDQPVRRYLSAKPRTTKTLVTVE